MGLPPTAPPPKKTTTLIFPMLGLNISGGIMVYPLPLFVKRFILHQDVDVYQVLAPGVGLGGQDPGGVEVAHILN